MDTQFPIDIASLRSRLHFIKHEAEELIKLLPRESPVDPLSIDTTLTLDSVSPEAATLLPRTLEGLFTGEKMIGSDGHEYHVPPNYASKSKLVCGDRMKLTITPTGSFIYKQIGPVERDRVIGKLDFDNEHNRWTVRAENKEYRVLTASISFYKGKVGDEVILLTPQNSQSEWACVDQLIAK
jgi:hypothetical protein